MSFEEKNNALCGSLFNVPQLTDAQYWTTFNEILQSFPNHNEEVMRPVRRRRHREEHQHDITDIPRRLRDHINPKAFKYYSSMPRCWYDAKDVIEAVHFGRLLNANQQRLNSAYNVSNELLTQSMRNINIIEYVQKNDDDDEKCWKWLRDHLKADNDSLHAIYDGMMVEMLAKNESKEKFNDLMMNHLDYKLHKERLHQNAWICTPTLDKSKISEHFKERTYTNHSKF